MANRPKMSSPTRAQIAAVTPSRARSTAVLAAPPPMFKTSSSTVISSPARGRWSSGGQRWSATTRPAQTTGRRGRGDRGRGRHGDGPRAMQRRCPAGSTIAGEVPATGAQSVARRVTTDCRSRRRSRRSRARDSEPFLLVGRALADQLLDLGDGQDLAFDQGLGHAFELVAVLLRAGGRRDRRPRGGCGRLPRRSPGRCARSGRGARSSRGRGTDAPRTSRKKTGPTRSLMPHCVTISRASRVACFEVVGGAGASGRRRPAARRPGRPWQRVEHRPGSGSRCS